MNSAQSCGLACWKVKFPQCSQQRWSPQKRLWPRGHNLKSLASKPASPQKFPVLRSRTALIFDLLKLGQGHEQFCFVLEQARQRSCEKKFLKTFF